MRHVFVLIDGTNCVLATETNIQKIYALSKKAGYRRCYQEGIGAFSRTRVRDVLFAPNLEPRALEVFQSLETLDLKKEDRLYIFGYSRGAVIARVLAMCIASSKHLHSAARIAGFHGSIPAQIELLCLFDPVVGPRVLRFSKSRVPNHDAVIEPKVKNYLELLSADENKMYFPSDSYSASRDTLKAIKSIPPTSVASTTADRQKAMTELNILKTRKAIWFPGTHADVGGHGGNSSIGLCALAIVVKEIERISQTAELGVAFPDEEVQNILAQIKSYKAPIETGSNWWVSKTLRRVRKRLNRRKPQTHALVQHFGHPLCRHYAGSAALLDEFPEYPT